MSRIYAGGNRATAIANITADVEAYISFDANGREVVDVDGLWGYLVAQGQAIITDAEYVSPATAATAAAAMKTINGRDMAQQLADLIGPQRWSSRPDWPTNTQQLTGGTQAAAVKSALAEVARLAAAVTAYYTDVSNRLKDILTDAYYRFGVDNDVPKGVVRIIETRAVIYTYVTDRGEESAPAPASAVVDMDQNDTVTYTAAAPPSGRNVTKIRWYRSNSSNTGAAFQFVAETVVGTLTYTDSLKAAELGEPCPTTLWAEPPATLAGLVEGPNGAVAGFTGNRFCPSINFIPYAFPREFEKTTAWPIVGIGVFQSTYVVLTQGNPYFWSGSSSDALAGGEVRCNQACVARLGIASDGDNVYYPSADGLCRANAGGVVVITKDLFSKAEWAALSPATIKAVVHEGAYMWTCTAGTYMLDLATLKLTTLDAAASAFYLDKLSDTVYLATGTTIRAMFAGAARTAVWKSKKIKLERPADMKWLQVDSDFGATVTVKVWRDGVLTDTKAVTSRTPVKLAPGKALEWEVEATAAVRLTMVTLASSAEELRQV